MTFYRKIANSDILKEVMDLPKNLRNKEVEILIFPYEKNNNDSKPSKEINSAKGLLENYKNTELIDEESNAWSKAVKEEYEDY